MCLKYWYLIFKFVGFVWNFGKVVNIIMFLFSGKGIVIGGDNG